MQHEINSFKKEKSVTLSKEAPPTFVLCMHFCRHSPYIFDSTLCLYVAHGRADCQGASCMHDDNMHWNWASQAKTCMRPLYLRMLNCWCHLHITTQVHGWALPHQQAECLPEGPSPLLRHASPECVVLRRVRRPAKKSVKMHSGNSRRRGRFSRGKHRNRHNLQVQAFLDRIDIVLRFEPRSRGCRYCRRRPRKPLSEVSRYYPCPSIPPPPG